MTSSQQQFWDPRDGSAGWHPRRERARKYDCPECNHRSFATNESFSRHLWNTHRIDPSTVVGAASLYHEVHARGPPIKANEATWEQQKRALQKEGSRREHKDYTPQVYDSPPSAGTPDSSDSEQSMHNNVDQPAWSPPARHRNSPDTAAADRIGRLSLEHPDPSSPSRGGRGILRASPTLASKRAASSELQRPAGRRSPAGVTSPPGPAGALQEHRTSNKSHRRDHVSSHHGYATHYSPHLDTADSLSWPHHQAHPHQRHSSGPIPPPIPRDSGYDTQPSRSSTIQPELKTSPKDDEYISVEPLSNPTRRTSKDEAPEYIGGVSLVRSKSRWPGLILQPESSPISQDQLATEVKGIYGGLVMVEAKCINIDAAQAADPSSSLGPEQWQALIALHRTLLYEHHDFLMATQHPSATPALRGLAQKYSMPARMWRHGIHAFLEVLRHRRPHSQDYMVAFVYLAYQMMALLFETVPSFTDTWIECLGDLARYRMAIEEDKEIHAIWGGVAARWYNTASDRHPSIGRLYHHLGILERPGIRKLFLYSKSLTCVIPFPNARDSLGTLCGPFIENEQPVHSGMRFAEVRMLRVHAYLYVNPEDDKIPQLASEACSALDQCPPAELRDAAFPLVIANNAAVLERGSPNNVPWQLYGNAINADIQSARPSAAAMTDFQLSNETEHNLPSPTPGTHASQSVYDFYCSSLHSLTRRGSSPQTNRDTLRAIHAILVWVHSIHVLRSKLKNGHDIHTLSLLLSPARFPWGGLCTTLNVLCQKFPVDSQIMEFARQEIFPNSGSSHSKPLLEDYLLRGLIWTQWYYPENFFGDQVTNEEAHMESSDPAVERSRADRIIWLALFLVFHGEYIKFDSKTASFSPAQVQEPLQVVVDGLGPSPSSTKAQSTSVKAPRSPSPTSTSPQSDSDGFLLVEPPKAKPAKTWASVVSKSSKASRVGADIHIVDDEEMREPG